MHWDSCLHFQKGGDRCALENTVAEQSLYIGHCLKEIFLSVLDRQLFEIIWNSNLLNHIKIVSTPHLTLWNKPKEDVNCL